MTNANTGIQYIDIKEFTDNVKMNELDSYYPVTGDGIFDTLMETATKHLTAQYKASRIRKEDYADAYAHIYEVTLQAAMAIWLQKPEQAAKVELLNAQTEHEYVKEEGTKAQTILIGEQSALTHAQTAHEAAKQEATEAQTDFIEAQTEHEASKKLNTEADTAIKAKQLDVMDTQIDAAEAEIDLRNAQTENTQADTKSKSVDALLKIAQVKFIKAQTKAADKDEQVKEAQAKSEEMKANLYKRQIEGFDEDYKQKLLKIGLDSWAVGFSVSKDTFAANANQIPAAMSKVALDDLFNQAIVPEVDIKAYKTSEDIVSSSSTIIHTPTPHSQNGSGG